MRKRKGRPRAVPTAARPATPSATAGKRGGEAYQEDRLSAAKKKPESQLNPSNLKAQTAAITAIQSTFDGLCTLLELLVKSPLEADQHCAAGRL